MAFPSPELDTLIRVAAFEHVRQLAQLHDHLTARELKPGFVFQGQRVPLINPQRGIFKPEALSKRSPPLLAKSSPLDLTFA